MSNNTMRFGGISLSHNPSNIKIQKGKSIQSVRFVSGIDKILDIRDSGVVISGKGELFGENCFSDYQKLVKLSVKDESQILYIPELGVFRAVLSKLCVAAAPKSDYLEIEFVFSVVESQRQSGKILPERYYYAESGENFWEIAEKFETTVEKLCKINPQTRNIMELSQGEEVRIY